MAHHRYPVHLNLNMFASVAVTVKKGVLVEVCVMPLDSHLVSNPEVKHFNAIINPEEGLENLTQDEQVFYSRGVTEYMAKLAFDRWFDNLKLGDKRLVPISHNWSVTKEHLIRVFGPETVEVSFHVRHREILSLANAICDHQDQQNRESSYPKTKLRSFTTRLKIQNPNPGNALNDAIIIPRVYKELLKTFT